jgi:hypothetical protein
MFRLGWCLRKLMMSITQGERREYDVLLQRIFADGNQV